MCMGGCPDRHCSVDVVIFMPAMQNIPVKSLHNFKSIIASSIN